MRHPSYSNIYGDSQGENSPSVITISDVRYLCPSVYYRRMNRKSLTISERREGESKTFSDGDLAALPVEKTHVQNSDFEKWEGTRN